MRLNEYIQKSLFPDIVPDFDPSERKIMGDWTFSMSDTNFVLKADILNKIKIEEPKPTITFLNNVIEYIEDRFPEYSI